MSLYDVNDVIGIVDNDTPINAALSSGSAALSLIALTTMTHRFNWLDMSDLQWDDIDTKVSLAITELMLSSTIESINTMLFIDPGLMLPTDPITNAKLVNPAAGSYQSTYYQILKLPLADNGWTLPDIYMNVGDYVLNIPVLTSNNSGKFDITIAGNTQAIDNYSAAETFIIHAKFFTVFSDGYHDLLIQCTGKNASSTNYYLIIKNMTIQKLP